MNKTYRLKTIADLCKIPKESLKNCLIDIGSCIVSYHAMNEVAPQNLMAIEEIEWIDDGRHDITINWKLKHE
jgi:hypothetical protein